jgi:hypothetical protein
MNTFKPIAALMAAGIIVTSYTCSLPQNFTCVQAHHKIGTINPSCDPGQTYDVYSSGTLSYTDGASAQVGSGYHTSWRYCNGQGYYYNCSLTPTYVSSAQYTVTAWMWYSNSGSQCSNWEF